MTVLRVRLLENFPFPGHPAPDELLRPAHPGDAGIDLYAAEEVTLLPGQRATVPTGIALALPEGTEGQVRPRSGNAARHGLGLLNAPGTIDSGYRGPVKVICYNSNPPFTAADLAELTEDGPTTLRDRLAVWLERHAIRIARGERIAQLVVARFERPEVRVVAELEATGRGEGGFGSTGTVTGKV